MTTSRFKETRMHIRALAVSKRGRNIITFLIFLVISTAFWFIMALNNEVQREFEVPLRITNLPSEVTLLSEVPSKVSVNIKDKGSSLIRWEWGRVPQLDLDFNQFQNNGKNIKMNNTQLAGSIRSAFGGSTNIVEVKPDSLYISFTTNPGIKKALNIMSGISVSPQHVQSGPIKISVDSVSVFSNSTLPKNLKIITDSIILVGLTDTAYLEVNIQQPAGMKIIPSTVKVTVPVEPLIAKKRSIPVIVSGAPEHMKVLTFPSSVEVQYTLPISFYNRDNFELKAYAHYDSLSKKLPLSLSTIPDSYRNVTLTTDSVEYLVEHR